MFGSAFKIARIFGIPIKVHVSLLILVFMFVAQIGWRDGLIIALGLLVSIVLHELGHSAVAIFAKCRVREITLMFMGGAAVMERMPSRPIMEFFMAIAGPFVSFCIAAVGAAVGYFYGDLVSPFGYNMGIALAQMNVMLMIFNLLPAFPMDGGRALRAALTPKLGRLKATRIAARIGQVMAVLFGIVGIFGAKGVSEPENWTLVVIAFFIFTAAGNEYRMVQMQEAMKQRGFTWQQGGDYGTPTGDQVVITPPPYEDGPAQRSDIKSD